MSTMNDRELLDLAAKAAGLEIGWSVKNTQVGQPDMYGVREYVKTECPVIAGVFWNPLDDDGDALRLAVKLQMQVTIYIVCADASLYGKDNVRENSHDQYAATRRAIVRAAAERGKAMP